MAIFDELLDTKVNTAFEDLIARWYQIRILVVTDSIVSFGPEHDPRNLNENYFGMSHLIGVLQQTAIVTRAHRNADPLTAANVISSFRFDQHDLSAYHQIWLLGYATGDLPEPEQAAMAAFMNRGGGVFATGDHEGLGSALAGSLPRVRSMRHWQSPPPALGLNRIDTTRPDKNNVVVFENQSDDIPQVLRIKRYLWAVGHYVRETYPHSLLCSSAGAITEFPDHMHEGEVVAPTDLTAQMALGNSKFDEYPVATDGSGSRVSPEVIAWGYTTGRADPEVMHDVHVGDPSTAVPRWTGTICVYDGRRAGVGRVVVHSTFHHFFDINLIGDNAANRPSFTDPRATLWRLGFTASSDGQRILGQVDQYYRNIVHWLSPSVGILWFDGLVAQLARMHVVREMLDTARNVSASELGAYAWEYAVRLFPPCMLLQLIYLPLAEIPLRLDPAGPIEGPDDSPYWHWPIPPKALAQTMLGAALVAFSRLKTVQEVHPENGITPLRTAALSAASALLAREISQTKANATQLERIGMLLSQRSAATAGHPTSYTDGLI